MPSFRVLRETVAVTPTGEVRFQRGDVLEGEPWTHPTNAYRRIRILANGRAFVFNEEDLEEVPTPLPD